MADCFPCFNQESQKKHGHFTLLFTFQKLIEKNNEWSKRIVTAVRTLFTMETERENVVLSRLLIPKGAFPYVPLQKTAHAW